MATNVGYATLDVVPNLKGFQGQLERGTRGGLASAGSSGGTIFGSAAGKSAGSRFTSIFKNAAKAGLVGLAGAGALAIKFGSDAVSAASDLEESTNKVSQIFGKSADDVLKFTKGTADALGQSNTAAREAASTFGIFGSAAGLAERKNAKFAKRMTTLASDLASFNNTEPDQAVQALGAALRGESEPIRAYGVMLDEATLKAEALALGILKPVKDQSKIFAYQTRITDLQQTYNEAVKEHGKSSLEALKAEASLGTARTALQKATEGTIPPLTQQQKLLAAQSQIFKQTEVAQGDFARTSDGLANQQRRLSARFEDAKAKLGQGLLPIMTQAADFLLDKGIPAFEDFSRWFNQKGIPAFKQFADDQGPRVVAVFQGIRDFAKEARPFAEGIVKAFDEMPGWVKKVLIGGAAGGLAAKKLGIGSLLGSTGKTGGGSGLLGLFTSAKPLPVFVTNPGGLGGGLGDGPGGKAAKFGILGALGTSGLIAGVAGGVTAGVSKALGKGNQGLLNAGSGGSGGIGSGDFFAGLNEDNGNGPIAKVEKFNAKLSESQRAFVDSKAKADDYFMFLKTGSPSQLSTRFTVTGVDTAKAEIRSYLDLLNQVASHVEDRLGAAGGSGPTQPGGKGTPHVPTRGVTVNNHFNVNTIGDAEKFDKHRRQQVAMGGFG